MAISDYFENIADAIRERAETSGTLTPAQMPNAILSIPDGGGGATYGTTDPDPSSGSDGDLYAKYTAGWGQVPFQINIEQCKRDDSVLNYGGALEIDLVFTNGNNDILMSQQANFSYTSSIPPISGGLANLFDGLTNTYVEFSPIPVWIRMQSDMPSGYYPKQLKVMQRSDMYNDYWSNFTLATNNQIILTENNLTFNDWAGKNTYTYFSLPILPTVQQVVGFYIKINGVWASII